MRIIIQLFLVLFSIVFSVLTPALTSAFFVIVAQLTDMHAVGEAFLGIFGFILGLIPPVFLILVLMDYFKAISNETTDSAIHIFMKTHEKYVLVEQENKHIGKQADTINNWLTD